MTTAATAVISALRNLALDLKLVKRAGIPLDEATTGRALEAFDLRLEKAGYTQQGSTLVKLADSADMLTKAHERITELEQMARPGGPAQMAVKQATPRTPTQADRYRWAAEQATDPVLRRGYWELATKHDKGLA